VEVTYKAFIDVWSVEDYACRKQFYDLFHNIQ